MRGFILKPEVMQLKWAPIDVNIHLNVHVNFKLQKEQTE